MSKFSFKNLFKKKYGFKSVITFSIISAMLSSYVTDLFNKTDKVDISNLKQVKIALKKEETKISQYLKSADVELKNGRFNEAKKILENVRLMMESMEKLVPDSVSFKEEIDSLKNDVVFLENFISDYANIVEKNEKISEIMSDCQKEARFGEKYLTNNDPDLLRNNLQVFIEDSTYTLDLIRSSSARNVVKEQAYAAWKAFLNDIITSLDNYFILLDDFEKKYPHNGGAEIKASLQHEYKILKGLVNSRL